MRDILPSSLMNEIASHLRNGCARGEQGWESANADEDALTGDLGASLRVEWRQVGVVHSINEAWRWRVTYTKFGGRGKGAPESILGADGIFQVEAEQAPGRFQNKGIIFQAKKITNANYPELRQQVAKMEELSPGASVVFEYGPGLYRGIESAAVIRMHGNLHDVPENHSARLGDFLADRFLPCLIGVRGMYYDANRKTLFVPHETYGVISYRARLRHRFKIEVRRIQ